MFFSHHIFKNLHCPRTFRRAACTQPAPIIIIRKDVTVKVPVCHILFFLSPEIYIYRRLQVQLHYNFHIAEADKSAQSLLYCLIFRTTRHGLPTATLPAGMSCVTTLPAPIMALSPMLTPGRMQAWPPIHTLLPIVTGCAYS